MAHTVAALVGSLRKDSFNRKAAQALAELAAPILVFDFVEIGNLPLYNQDLDVDPPQVWKVFRDRVGTADAVLFATPEYNRSVPGVLKNAIDVGSRPYGKSSFLEKPTGIISNSPGPLGGVNAAKALQNILPGICGTIMGQPETYLNGIGDAFNEKGEIVKEGLQKVLEQYLTAFAKFVEKQNA
jgi:chromate reductase